MQATSRVEALFTATLSAALLALGVTAFSTIEREPSAAPVAQATLPAVTVVGKRPAAAATTVAQNAGSAARKAS